MADIGVGTGQASSGVCNELFQGSTTMLMADVTGAVRARRRRCRPFKRFQIKFSNLALG